MIGFRCLVFIDNYARGAFAILAAEEHRVGTDGLGVDIGPVGRKRAFDIRDTFIEAFGERRSMPRLP